jgi:hypothetical protein
MRISDQESRLRSMSWAGLHELSTLLEVNKGITGHEPYSEKLRNIGFKVKKKQCLTDYVSYLSTQYFVIFLEYCSCPVMPLFTSSSAATDPQYMPNIVLA